MSLFRDMIDKVAKGEKLDEVSPPGFKGTVKSLKKRHSDEVDNPYALAWWMKNKGYKSHKKASGGPVSESQNSLPPGTKVTVAHGSGLNSGKPGYVVDRNEIKTDGRGVPTNTWDDPYKPVDWNQEVAVRLGNGELITMYNDRLIADPNTQYTGLADEADGAGGGGSSGMTSQIEGGGDSVYSGMEPGAYQDILSHQPEIEPDLDEETGDNYSQTSGTGSPDSPWYQLDPTETFPTEDEGKSTLAASVGNGGNYPTEAIRVEHPENGLGTVVEINDADIVVEWDNMQLKVLGPERLKFSEAKYLFRVKEAYSDDPQEVEVGKKKKKKKGIKVKESGALATLPGATAAPSEWDERISDDPDDAPTSPEYIAPGGLKGIIDLGVIDSMKDRAHRKDKRHKTHKNSTLLGEGKMTKKRKQLDEHMMAIPGMFVGSAEKKDKMNIDLAFDDLVEYELPDPSDSILTNQNATGAPKVEPLSVEPGAEAAGDGGSPDGDYATDLVPDDAPDVIKYDAMGDEAGNTRDSSSGEPGADLSSTNKSSGDSSSSESSSDDSSSGEYNFSKKEDKPENADGGEEEDNMKESLTWEDLGLVAEEYEDEESIGMPEENVEMNEHSMGQGEVAMTKELLSKLLYAIKEQNPDEEKCEAICNGLIAAGNQEDRTLDIGDIAMIMGEIKNAHAGNSEGGQEAEVGNEPDYSENEGMQVDDEMDSPSSVGDEGCGEMEYEDKAEGDGERAGPEGGEEHEGKTKLMDKKGKMKEQKGGSKPVSQNTSKGSGPGGGNTGEFGQKDGTVKQVKSGKETGVPGAPLSKEGGGKTVPPISESVEQIDEHMVAVGMAGLGSTYRGGGEHAAEMDALTEEEKEMAMIKRRAGLENWWKK